MFSVRDRTQIRSWLVAIAANEARQHVRRRRRATVVDISHAMSAPSPVDPDFARIVDLERALGDLGADDRRLIALRYIAGLDSSEIAPLVGLSSSGVRSRLARVLERLRFVLEPEGGSTE
jgi:RNA polymerase sigma factor (sigma-70 family)